MNNFSKDQGSWVQELESRIERLETCELAREVSWRYATAVDIPDLTMLSAVFTPDVELTTSKGTVNGITEVMEYYSTGLSAPLARRHFLSNQSLSILGPGRARMDSYFIYTLAGDLTSVLGWGTYCDHIRIINGTGFIESKRITVNVHADSRTGWASASDPLD